MTVRELARIHGRSQSFAYLDERSKRAVRRAILTAMAMPGRQVPFVSREMPVARGWGSGGLQVTLSLVGPDDCVKVIDQGSDHSTNATAMRELIVATAGATPTTDAREATILQSRHRIPDTPLREDQVLVLQLPHAEPLRRVVTGAARQRAAHLDGDHTAAWLEVYDDIVRFGEPRTGADYPILVEGMTLASPSPIPRHDVLRLDDLPHPVILGAGRHARIVALPPHTRVEPLIFADHPLRAEQTGGTCSLCGSADAYLVPDSAGFELSEAAETGVWRCSDTDACTRRQEERHA